jgi:seryl-tRNA synthetase
MLTLPFLRQEKDRVLAGLKKRHFQHLDLVDTALGLDDERRALQFKLDNCNGESKRLAAEIGGLMKQGKTAEADAAKAKVAENKELVRTYTEELAAAETALENTMYQIPNVPHTSVVAGKVAEDNEVFKDWTAEMPTLPEGALPHWELAAKYDIIDFELGVKITGAGFPVYKGKGARLQRALINFFLDEATAAGYREVQVPHLVNEASAYGTGQLPDKEGQMYHSTVDNFYLIPTAEVPITNIFRDVILAEAELPQKLTGYTPCFRREAGSYGAHVRGLNRLHQFDKVEIVQVAHPEKSYEALLDMVAHVENLLAKLELPYRILRLCGGDMGFTSALTYDFETYSAAQERWLEVSSTSNFETFQANRLKLRYRDGDKKNHLAHTLNGSALALPRIVATLLENHQTPEGIKIPAALVPYCGFEMIN